MEIDLEDATREQLVKHIQGQQEKIGKLEADLHKLNRLIWHLPDDFEHHLLMLKNSVAEIKKAAEVAGPYDPYLYE